MTHAAARTSTLWETLPSVPQRKTRNKSPAKKKQYNRHAPKLIKLSVPHIQSPDWAALIIEIRRSRVAWAQMYKAFRISEYKLEKVIAGELEPTWSQGQAILAIHSKLCKPQVKEK